jgi:hypothetical protein
MASVTAVASMTAVAAMASVMRMLYIMGVSDMHRVDAVRVNVALGFVRHYLASFCQYVLRRNYGR